jgi:hypothetical protein
MPKSAAVPTELCADEIELYNSIHSIASTGRDIDGRLEPFRYTRFGRPLRAGIDKRCSFVGYS